MKKIVALMIAMTLSVSLFAQIALLNYDVQEQPYEIYENGAIVEVSGVVGDSAELVAHLGIWNQGSNAVNVICSRTDLEVVEGSSNYFCWGSCFTSNTYISFPVPMDPAFVDFYGFTAHYGMGTDSISWNLFPLQEGTTKVRYSFYDERNPQDSVWVIVHYTVGNVSVNELTNNVVSNVYPNPANHKIFVETSVTENSIIAIYNMLGQQVKEVAVTSEKTEINISDLKNGIYLYSIIANGKKVDTKRFIVSR